jgi:hypothetical protein
MTCPHRNDGSCAIAAGLAGVPRESFRHCQDAACEACEKTEPPRAINRITISLAAAHCRQIGCPDENKAELKKAGAYVESHPLKPTKAAELLAQPGPGTELHKILARLGFKIQEDCPCLRRIAKMNEWGPEGCKKHIETIVNWLGCEAVQRRKHWLFWRWVTRLVVRYAVKKSKACCKGGTCSRA